ncbi:hypothetical protein N9J49_07295 [Amylibacter sp.]|nr:hypothetical protein [Amylibacter sp.]
MLKILVKPVFVAFLISLSSPASANGYIESIEQCLAAHQSGDKGKVKLIASEISSIKMYGDQTRIDAAKCMSHAYGGEWVYDHSAKAMIIKNKIVTELSDEEENIRKKIKQIILDQPNLTSSDKVILLKELYNTISSNEVYRQNLRIELMGLFAVLLEVPISVVYDVFYNFLNVLPPNETAIDKLSISIPNSSILTFRKFIEDDKNLILDASIRRRVIKNIDKAILKETNGKKFDAKGAEKDAKGNAKLIYNADEITLATNIDTDVEFFGLAKPPKGMKIEEFNELFSVSHNEIFVAKKEITKNKIPFQRIKWNLLSSAIKGVSFDDFLIFSFGTATENVKFKVKRKLYHPIVRGVGFNLIELEYPTLSECIKAIKNGIKLSNQDIFFEKAIYKFDVGKFPWKGEQQFFQCERYGISDDETVYYTQSRMLPE